LGKPYRRRRLLVYSCTGSLAPRTVPPIEGAMQYPSDSTIHLSLSQELKAILRANGIDPETYRPAYSGTSIGLDLFNVGPDIDLDSCTTPYIDSSCASNTTRVFKQLFKTLISTGLRIHLPPQWVATIQERGSVTKTPLKVRAGIIDPGYSGEIFANCVNLSFCPYTIQHGAKLPFQLVVVQANTNFCHVTPSEYERLTASSTRKEGKIGSSDT
jgi:dUTPase